MIVHPEYTKLITALYSSDSEYVESDTVFGVKKSLVVEYKWSEDLGLAREHNLIPMEREVDGRKSMGFWLLDRDFVLVKKSLPPPRKVMDD